MTLSWDDVAPFSGLPNVRIGANQLRPIPMAGFRQYDVQFVDSAAFGFPCLSNGLESPDKCLRFDQVYAVVEPVYSFDLTRNSRTYLRVIGDEDCSAFPIKLGLESSRRGRPH